MMNILSNAIKYNLEGGKIYITCREVSCTGGTSLIELKCRDTGIGMEPGFLEHVFDPFTQEDENSRSEYGGTGLGMAITKSLVDKMGGAIDVESEKGAGTTFDVVIPFEVGSEKAEAHDGQADSAPARIAGLTVLLAEDNELNMEIARFLLEEEGARVLAARDGGQAVEAFAASEPGDIDAVLMDVMMPRMNGYDATRAIRQRPGPTPRGCPSSP